MEVWSGLIGAVVGAIIGIGGALGAQVLANRAEANRLDAERSERLRAEIRSALDVFLRAAQRAEQAAHDGDNTDRKGDAATEMWIAYKSLALVAEPGICEAALTYCDALSACLWNPDSRQPWEAVHGPQLHFNEVARHALQNM